MEWFQAWIDTDSTSGHLMDDGFDTFDLTSSVDRPRVSLVERLQYSSQVFYLFSSIVHKPLL